MTLRATGLVAAALVLITACGSGIASPTPSRSPRASASPAASPPVSSDWTEYHRDASRSGVGPSEPALTNPTVAWKIAVDADVYASPLIVAGHVIVATENNTVYSLDIFTGAVVWQKHLGDPVDAGSLLCGDISPITGITGTPAVDPATGKLYVVAYLAGHHHVLYSLSLVDGSVLWSQDIDPAQSTPAVEQQRGALAIGSGRVYIPLGGLYGDCGPYHGYVVAAPLAGGQAVAFRVPSPREAGIWSAMGVTLDPSGNVYFVTGNGGSSSSFDLSNSIVELSPDLQSVVSYFAPTNWRSLGETDTDLGALGATVLSRSGLVVAVGKDGVAYVAGAGALGGIGGQKVRFPLCAGAYGGTSWSGSTVLVPCADGLYAISVSASAVGVVWRNGSVRSGSPIVAAGVVWAIDSSSAVLYALNPSTGAVRYSKALGAAAHFSTPAATDGFVVAPAGRNLIAISVES